MDKRYWWGKALEASNLVGWFPTVILAQWQLETGNFMSPNLRNNNNIAGQTWTSQYPVSMIGTPRPKAEGGYYVKYADPVDGYVDFIRRNPRYHKVQEQTTEEGQIDAIARAGWAVDPHYSEKLIRILNNNREEGFEMETLSRADGEQVVLILKDYYERMNGNPEIQEFTHYLAERIRAVSGIPSERA